MARLHIQLDGAPVLSRELKWGITRIGRGADNDVVISHPSLSQHHCEMELGIDFLKVRDLGSTNGTTVGNRTVSEAFLAPGETLWFGQVPATVEWSQESVNVPDIEAQRLPASVELGEGVLSCIKHTAAVASWHCEGCDRYFCSSCIKDVRLVGRPPRRVCPECSQPVVLAPWADGGQRKQSLWKRIKTTVTRAAGLR
jgi:DNA-directed RNA polymerase subunit RPC12/RpoP